MAFLWRSLWLVFVAGLAFAVAGGNLNVGSLRVPIKPFAGRKLSRREVEVNEKADAALWTLLCEQ